MPKSCAVIGCSNHSMMGKQGLSFYTFPHGPAAAERRQLWMRAVNRVRKDGKEWVPTKNSPICSEHFVTGRPNSSPDHIDYVPTLFFVPTEGLPRARATSEHHRETAQVRKDREAAKRLWLQEMRATMGQALFKRKPTPASAAAGKPPSPHSPAINDEPSAKKSRFICEAAVRKLASSHSHNKSALEQELSPAPNHTGEQLRDARDVVPPPNPAARSAFLHIQNERMRVSNGRLQHENARLKTDLAKYKQLITKFVAVRKEMQKLGIGLPPCTRVVSPAAATDGSTRGDHSPPQAAMLNVPDTFNETNAAFSMVPDESRGYINIAPIDDGMDDFAHLVAGSYGETQPVVGKIEHVENHMFGSADFATLALPSPMEDQIAKPVDSCKILAIQPTTMTSEGWFPQITNVFSTVTADIDSQPRPDPP